VRLLLSTQQRQSDMNGRNNAGDNVYHCRECVSLGKLIYLAVVCT
jgi:hypothetical protein